MQLCTKCVLPETFPGVKLDDEGVCSHCRAYKGEAAVESQKAKYLEKFERLWNERQLPSRWRSWNCSCAVPPLSKLRRRLSPARCRSRGT